MHKVVLASALVSGLSIASDYASAEARWVRCDLTVTVKNETDERIVLNAGKTKTNLMQGNNNPIFNSDKVINANRTKLFDFTINSCYQYSYNLHIFTFVFNINGSEKKITKSLLPFYDQNFTIRVRD